MEEEIALQIIINRAETQTKLMQEFTDVRNRFEELKTLVQSMISSHGEMGVKYNFLAQKVNELEKPTIPLDEKMYEPIRKAIELYEERMKKIEYDVTILKTKDY